MNFYVDFKLYLAWSSFLVHKLWSVSQNWPTPIHTVLLYKLLLCPCVVVCMCVCKTYDYDHVKWHTWQFLQNLNDLEMLKYYHLGLYINKKSLPTLVALNDFLNATMPVLSKLLYITKCYTCVWFQLMRLVEIVIADVLSSKNNKKYFQMIFESLWVISVAVERKVWLKYQKQYHIFECVFLYRLITDSKYFVLK